MYNTKIAHSRIANKYILHVLVKEVMATTLCIQKGFPYEAANKFCQETEVDLHEALRKVKKYSFHFII